MDRVLLEQDPDRMIAELDIEDIEQQFPDIKIKRVAKQYMDKDQIEDANKMKELLATIEIQRQQSIQPQAPQGAPMVPPMAPQGMPV